MKKEGAPLSCPWPLEMCECEGHAPCSQHDMCKDELIKKMCRRGQYVIPATPRPFKLPNTRIEIDV
jgi:hypothetical protein